MLKLINRLKRKRIWLITGVAGFIGSNTAYYLLKNNQIVLGIDNLKTSEISNLKKLRKFKNFKFYKLDLTRKFQINKKVDYCIHLAALNSVPRSFDYPIEVSQNNILSFINVISFCAKINVRKIIYASSSSVYGNSKKKIKKETQYIDPISPYAISKITNEYFAKIYSNKFMKIIGLRFFNVYGYNQKNQKKYSAVIPTWLNSIKKKNIIEVFGDSSREFCYIDDAVRSILLTAFYKSRKNYEIFNISGGKKINIKNLAKKFKNIFGNQNTKIVYKKIRVGDIKNAQASIRKIKECTGFEPKFNIDEGLKKIKYIKDHY